MGFAQQVQKWVTKTEANLQAAREGIDELTFESIVEGSTITGSPGQPVDPQNDPNAGKLHDSWEMEKEGWLTTIATDVDYAPSVEDDTKGQHFRNHGPHSKKLTEAGFPRIVQDVANRVSK